MQYGRSAFQTSSGEKSGHRDRSPKGCCLQPAGAFAQGQNSNFHFHLSLLTAFGLCRAVLQAPFTDWYAGRGVAQCLAFNQQTGEFDAVQPSFPYKYA